MKPLKIEELNYLLARVRPDLDYQTKVKLKGDAWPMSVLTPYGHVK